MLLERKNLASRPSGELEGRTMAKLGLFYWCESLEDGFGRFVQQVMQCELTLIYTFALIIFLFY